MKKIDWANQITNFIGVIFGVWLAFYISDSAERHKEKAVLKEMMGSLIEDLAVDIKVYQELIPANEEQYASVEGLVMAIIGEGSEEQAQIGLDVKNHNPAHATYLSMKSYSGMALIRDFGIGKKLSNYYELELRESTELGDLQFQYFLNEITPWLIKNTELFNFETEDVKGDIELANRLLFYNVLIAGKTEQYKEMLSRAEELKESLEGIVLAL